MKVGIVTETFAPEINGVAMTLGKLTEGLSALAHQIDVICPSRLDRNEDCCHPNISIKMIPGFPIPGYPELRFGLPAWVKIKRILKRNKPDVLYVATEGPLGFVTAVIARKMKIPIVSGFHTNFHQYSQHYGIGKLQRPVFSYLRRFHNNTAVTLVPTPVLQAELRSNGIDNAQVLSRGVDAHLYAPQKRDSDLRASWGLGDDDIALIYVGRIAPEKNLNLLINCYRHLQQKHTSIRLIIVGDGPTRVSLQQNSPDVIFCGIKTGEDLAAYYASGDIFLFPSVTETFGNVVLEALASGLAVVGFNYAAVNMHIEHLQNGMACGYADERSFIEATELLVNDKALLSHVRKMAREHSLAYTWERIAQEFASILSAQVIGTEQSTAMPLAANQ